jgi:dihydroorotate dehydrogenase
MLGKTYPLLRSVLFAMSPETAHHFTLNTLSAAPWLAGGLAAPTTGPYCTLAGLKLAGPIGLAAGLDKDGVALDAWPRLGFGFVEVGTVTPRPQPGNPRPRMFRLKAEGALINRMGFNNAGVDALAGRLRAHRERNQATIPIGVNIGKNKDTPLEKAANDYAICARAVSNLADYLVVNVSSPNTPGLRSLQDREPLERILDATRKNAPHLPIFLKLSPDLPDRDLFEAIDVAKASKLHGIVCANTTLTRPGTTGRLGESGGLSGRPLGPIAAQKIQAAVERANGELAVIGVGGIDSPERATALIDVGVDAVQVYSAFIFQGPALIAALDQAVRRALLARPAEQT